MHEHLKINTGPFFVNCKLVGLNKSEFAYGLSLAIYSNYNIFIKPKKIEKEIINNVLNKSEETYKKYGHFSFPCYKLGKKLEKSAEKLSKTLTIATEVWIKLLLILAKHEEKLNVHKKIQT